MITTIPTTEQIVEYSNNWNNKLNCQYHTTLRLPGKKYTPGNKLHVILKGEYIYDAQIISVKKIMLRDLDDFTATLDTGYNAKDTVAMLVKMYKNYDFNVNPVCMVLLKQLPAGSIF